MDSITYNSNSNSDSNNRECDDSFTSPHKRKQPYQRDDDVLFVTPSSLHNEDDPNDNDPNMTL